jgi:hypothetical protein
MANLAGIGINGVVQVETQVLVTNRNLFGLFLNRILHKK